MCLCGILFSFLPTNLSLSLSLSLSKCHRSTSLSSFPQLPLSPSSSFSALSLSPPSPGGLAWALSKAQPKSAIPGPTGLPILGLVFAFTSSLTHRLLSTLAKSHDVGMTRFIISSDPDTAKEILNSPVFATHLFSPKSINGFGPGRKEIGLKMVNEIKGLMVEKGVVDVKRVLHFGSLNNVMMSVFGRCYEFGGKDGAGDGLELEGLVSEGYELLGMFNWSDHFPVLCWLDLQGVRRRCREFVGRVNVFVGKIIEEHRLKRAEKGGVGDESSGDFVRKEKHLKSLTVFGEGTQTREGEAREETPANHPHRFIAPQKLFRCTRYC